MVDNLNWNTVLAVFYTCYVVTLFLAGRVLWKFRGNSLLAISVICLTVQVGTILYWLPGIVADGPGRVFQPAFTRLAVGMTIYCVVSSLMLLLFIRIFKPEPRMQYERPAMSHLLLIAAASIALLYVFIRLRSGSAELVFQQGKEVLGGAAYYELRAELGEAQVQNYNRIVAHFENVARKFLYILLVVSSYLLGRYRKTETLILILVFAAVLLLDEIIRFQKAPIMIVLAGAILPYFLASPTLKKQSVSRQVLMWGAGGVFAALVGAAITVITMGVPPREVMWFVTDRLIVVPAYTGSMHFQVYPEMNPFVEFTSLRIVTALRNMEPLTYSGLISMDVAEAITGTRYNANSSYVADAYANAGYLGILGVTLVISMFFMAMDRYVSRIRRNRDVTPLLFFYWSCAVTFGNGSVISIIVSNALWFVPVIYPFLFRQRGVVLPVSQSGAATGSATGPSLLRPKPAG